MAGKTHRVTWMELAVRNGGFRNAVRGLTWAYMWGVTRIELGRKPTVEEIAESWNEAVRTTYRGQASFRASFPDLDDPSPIMDTPVAQESMRRGIEAAEQLGEVVRDFKQQRREKAQSLDSSILRIGLAGPR